MDIESRTKEAAAFLAELETLCRKHGIIVAVSDYDNLQIWRAGSLLSPVEADIREMIDNIQDRTNR